MNRGRGIPAAGIGLLLAFAACAASVFWVVGGVSPWRGSPSSNVWHHY